MPIRKDLSHLVRGSPPTQYHDRVPAADRSHPDPVLDSVVRSLVERLEAGADREMSAEAVIRASSAGMDCRRAIQYQMRRTPETNPNNLADLYRMNLGTIVHDWLEAAEWPEGTRHEPKFTINADGVTLVAGHGDVANGGTAYEFKTKNGTAFKTARLEGPTLGDIRQLALAVRGQGLDDGWIVYLAMELISVDKARNLALTGPFDRFLYSWHFDHEYLNQVAEEEIGFFASFAVYEHPPALVPRQVGRSEHNGEPLSMVVVTDPSGPRGKGRYIGTDGVATSSPVNVWQCGYCRYQDRCTTDGP